MLDHRHGVGTARDNAAGGNRRRRAGRQFDDGLHAAGDDFSIECEPFRIAIAGADGIGRAHCKTVDIGAVERRGIDRRNDVSREHARQCRRERQHFAGKRRTIDTGLEAATRLLRGNHFEELLLPRRTAHRVKNCRSGSAVLRV